MNFKELSEKLGLEEDEYIEIIELFIETGMSDLEKLKSSIESANTEKTAKIVHSIKGAALNLGLMEFFEIAQGIEKKAHDGYLEETSCIAMELQEKMNNIAGLVR